MGRNLASEALGFAPIRTPYRAMLRAMSAPKPPLEPLDLDAACAALARAAASPAPPDRRVLAWHADLCRALVPGLGARPLRLVLPFGALPPAARRLVGLLIVTARQVPSMRAAARRFGQRAFVGPAAALAERLPPEIVCSTGLRQEELIRRWAAAVGAPVAVGGRPEPAARSGRVLERLDYARIRDEEAKLEAERTIAEARRAALAKVSAGGAL